MADSDGGARDARIASAESEAAIVQAAVEQFVERHSCGDAPDLAQFVQVYPEALRARVMVECREFLAFDGLLGHQQWEAQPENESEDSGRTFGDFVIQEELGRGGMGVVYLARQRSLNRRVALKVMASGLTLSKRHVERFRREAAATARLRHPAIVQVHSLEEVDGTFAIAMDYIAGRNLGDILDDLRLANGPDATSIEGTLGLEPDKGYVAECAIYCAQLASALESAHQQGVVHRDLKPRNLMIDDRQQVRLLDFGLSKSLGDGSISLSGEITGSVHYMSPEQTLAKRVPVDHRTDVFALGVILYELLTLKRPFDGKNMQQTVYEICFKEPVSPQRLNPKVPRDLVTICSKALEKDPGNRYQSAGEFRADLLRFLSWEPIHARPADALTRFSKWVHRHHTETIAALAVIGIAAGGLGYSWYGAVQDDREADRLVQQAHSQHAAGELEPAFQSATLALTRRDDPEIRTLIDLCRQKIETAAVQEEVDIAEAARLSLASNQTIARDRELAVILALAAVDRRADSESRSAVLEAIGSGYRTTTLAGHGGNVLCARWSPDGTTVLTAGTDPEHGQDAASAILWNSDGTVLHTLRGHRHWIVDAAFHPDGERVATASIDGTVRLWNLRDGTPAGRWNHDYAVQSVRFDAAGQRALTHGYASQSGPFHAQVWDVERGVSLAVKPHTRFVRAAAISPSGRFAASAGGAGQPALWSVDDGRELARLAGHRGRISVLEFSPDSATVAVAATDGAVRLYSVPEGRLLATAAHSRSVTSLEFGTDGQRLLTAGGDLSARLWRLEGVGTTDLRLREEQLFVGHVGTVTSARFDPSGQFVVTGCDDGVLRVFDAGSEQRAAGVELMRYEAGGVIAGAAAFAPGANAMRILAIAGPKRAVIWDFADARGVATLRQRGKVPAAGFDAAGDRVVTAGDDERLRLWNARDGSLVWVSNKLGNPILALDIDADGERIAATTARDGTIHVHGLVDGEPLFSLPTGDDSLPIVRFAAGGNRILAAGKSGIARVYDASDRSEVLALARPSEILAADLSADGTLLVTLEKDASIARLWTVVDGQPHGEVGGGDAAAKLRSVAFRPDGKALLCAGADGTVYVTDLDGTQLSAIATGNPIVHAAWSRDGNRVLTSSTGDGNLARLWNVGAGTEELRFGGHTGTVECNAFSPDGNWAVTASRDGTARIWPTDPVGLARRLKLRGLSPNERRIYRLDRKPD